MVGYPKRKAAAICAVALVSGLAGAVFAQAETGFAQPLAAGTQIAQIVPPFTSFGPGIVPPFGSPMRPPHPHPRPPFPPPIPFPFFGVSTDGDAAGAPSNVNITINPAPAPPPPQVIVNPPSSEISPSGVEVVRLMSTSPAPVK